MRIRVARAVGRLWGGVRHSFARGERRRAAAALAAARPDLDPPARRRLVRESFRHRGSVAWEQRLAVRLDLVDLCRHLTLGGWEHLHEAESAGRGVLVLTGVGGYPGVAARAAEVYAGPLRAVAGGEDLAAAEGVLLGGGKVVFELGRPPDSAAESAARLALAAGAPAVPVIALAAPRGRYRLAFAAAIWPSEVSGQAPERAVAVLAGRFRAATAGAPPGGDRGEER